MLITKYSVVKSVLIKVNKNLKKLFVLYKSMSIYSFLFQFKNIYLVLATK